ncbi:hypothetical protein TEA_013992 [Camellia sinensis var. sinensis]|uniref:Sugar phosphate transporter domain-containing protein n=1 Tax=Camellia sinensis var. sinensis TaxID=542762 RepID=A0A4S4ERW6_CAMSN|nr:hypothetical protein TEA_013992 [Camellia sinensis var. sinensis]
MASIASSTQLLLNRSPFSPLHSSPSKVLPNLVLLKSRSVVFRASRLEFSPLPENRFSPVEFSGKTLRLPGWSQLLRRHHSVEFPVAKAAAADADGGEIEISDGSGLPIDKELLTVLTPVAFCHALGHVMSNVSFAAVAVSFTHTIKALEPFFNAAASQFILGHQIPLPLWLSLAPVVFGVSMASLTELSFNWTGFISAMISNIAFTYRSIYSKKAMTGMDSTNVYAYISIIALLVCIPPALIIEGPQLMQHGFADAIAKVGLPKFLSDLFWIGMFYHLYNQVATNTLERVAPLTHAVGNVLKRVFVIGFSIVVFGNRISTQTGIGTVIAIVGVAIYSLIKANMEEKKRVKFYYLLSVKPHHLSVKR